MARFVMLLVACLLCATVATGASSNQDPAVIKQAVEAIKAQLVKALADIDALLKSLETPEPEPEPEPPPPPPPTAGVLQPSDFTYVGEVRFPVFGAGALAGSNVNGQIRLRQLTENADNGGKLYSAVYTGNAVLGTGPNLAVAFEGYPTWNGNDRRDISYEYPSGAVRSSYTNFNPWPRLGLAEHAGKLYISYLDYYNSDYMHTDHCLLVVDLTQSGDSRTKGPYRFANTSVKRVCGNVFVTPQGLGMTGAMMAISRNMDQSWGPALSIMPWTEIGSNQGGFNSPKLNVSTRLMHSITERASRASDYIPDTNNPFNPDIVPPPGFWTQRDRMNTVAWVETNSGKSGLVSMGGMAVGQVWYGNYDKGPNGAVDECQSASQGENADSYRAEWRIYDIAKLNGGVVQPDHIFDPKSRPNGQHLNFICQHYSTGAYWDQPSGLLFVASGHVIQVWRVQ